jgi:ribosomal protein S3
VQLSGARNSRVGCFSEGRIAHQTKLEFSITPAFTSAAM